MKNKKLFRGKRLDNGEWVIGYYVCLNEKEHRIYSGYAETDCGDYYPDWWSVDPDTVGQYIGKRDKNKRKIFEGDILISAWNTRIVIYFDEDYLQFRAREVSLAPRHNSIDYYDNNRMEIIGNTQDNPDLMKKHR